MNVQKVFGIPLYAMMATILMAFVIMGFKGSKDIRSRAQVYPTPYVTPTPNGKPCGVVAHGMYYCSNKFTCLRCFNGITNQVERKYCKNNTLEVGYTGANSCYYEAPSILKNPNYYTQTDSRWAFLEFAPGCAFWKRSCGQTVLAMILRSIGKPYTPPKVQETYFAPNRTCFGTTPSQNTSVLQQNGIKYTTPVQLLTIDRIKSHINQGKKVMMLCTVNGIDHWTLAWKVNSGYVILSDPLYGDGLRLTKDISINLSNCQIYIVI